MENEKIIFKGPIRIELDTAFLMLWIIGPILIISHKLPLFFYFYPTITLSYLFLTSRRLYIYEDRIMVKLLYKKETLLYKDIEKVLYSFPAPGTPLIIFKNKIYPKNVFVKLYYKHLYKFVAFNEGRLIMYLIFFKKKDIKIEFVCSDGTTRRLNEAVFGKVK